jgi:WS/DGAT/MGAT family acyltransferase
MAGTAYERLSAQDRSFFVFEDASAHMHLGGLALFDAGPLRTAEGGIDIALIRAHIASRLHLVPRYRQRLAWVPIFNRPVWVDDGHFNLHYHVRHTALPHPGADRQLKDLAARILSQQLDRGKPLWELWIIERLEGNCFSMLVKTHHAVADGISALDLFSALLSPVVDDTVGEPAPWTPHPAPSPLTLLRDEIVRQTTAPLGLALDLARGLCAPGQLYHRAAERMQAVWDLVSAGLPLPSRTPINGPIGPHRQFDWLTLDLTKVKEVKNRFGGTVNDVVLSTVAGAVGHFLARRRVDVRRLEYRAVVPVTVRTEDERGIINNRVSAWLMTLPIGEPDARRRLALVQATTEHLKTSKQALGPEVLGQAAEYAIPGLLTVGVRLTARLHPYNLIVTNVPGPQLPLYLLGARLLGGYPQVPLFENQGLGVGLSSYCGALHWGFNADWDLMPDLGEFVAAVGTAFEELHRAARAEPSSQVTGAARR